MVEGRNYRVRTASMRKSIFSYLPILVTIRRTNFQEGKTMSRESRDGRKPHESDDDARSNHSADETTRTIKTKSSRKTSPRDSERLHRHDREHRRDHNRRSDVESRGEHEHHSHRESSDDARAIVVRRRGRGNPASPRLRSPGRRAAAFPPRARSAPRSHPRSNDEHIGDHAADQAKFASYDDDDRNRRRSDAAGYSQEPQAQRSYRAEPAHRPYRRLPCRRTARSGRGPGPGSSANGRAAAGHGCLAAIRPRTRRRWPIQVRPIAAPACIPTIIIGPS